VDACVLLILVVLDILDQTAVGGVDGEDVAIARVVVKGRAVDVIRGFVRGQDEDGAGVAFATGGQSCRSDQHQRRQRKDGSVHTVTSKRMGRLMYNICWAVDGEAVPFFHGSAVEGFLVMLDNISEW
jgi:hypothetical protein